MYRGLASALIILFAGSVLAQTPPCEITISGRVIDEHDGQPLSFAEVVIGELSKGTVVDSSGNYRLQGICPGEYTITAYHVGCRPVTKKVMIEDENEDLDFYLEHHAELLEEARIMAIRARSSAEARGRLSGQRVETVRGKDIGDALELISGVNSLKTGNSIAKPVIHGLYGSRVVTINQGIRQEDQQWGMEHGLNIDLFSVDEISVIKGVAAVEHGAGAVGGVVKLGAKELPFDTSGMGGSAYLIGESNGRGGSAALELEQGVNDEIAYRLRLSGQRLGDRNAPGYVLSNTGSQGFNASFRMGYRHNAWDVETYYSHFSRELGILRGSHLGNLSDFRQAISREEPLYVGPFAYAIDDPRQELTHDLWKLSFKYEINENHLLDVRYGIQQDHRKEFDIRRGGRNDPANNLKLLTQTLDMKLNSRYTRAWTATYGASGMLQENSNVPGTGRRPILPNYNLYRVGAFATHKYQPHPWIFEAGLRYDYDYIFAQKYDHVQNLLQLPFHFANLAASGGATYAFNQSWQFSTQLAYAYRAPHVNELLSEGLHHGAATIEVGDANLTPEKSLNWSNTLTVNYPEQLKAELTLYANPFRDYIYLRPEPEPQLTVRGAFPLYQYTQDDVILAGSDLSAEVTLPGNFTYRLRGNYVRGYNVQQREDLVFMSPPRAAHAVRYELARPSKKLHNWFAEVGQELVGHQSRYPKNRDLAPPPDAYQLLNLSAGFTRSYPNGQALRFSVTGENLLNTAYRDYLNRFRYFADQMGFNLILRIKYEF